jgi:hypothetical protein
MLPPKGRESKLEARNSKQENEESTCIARPGPALDTALEKGIPDLRFSSSEFRSSLDVQPVVYFAGDGCNEG